VKNVLLLASVAISFLFLSCNEDFSPKTDIADAIVLYSVLETDYPLYGTFYPEATLSKVYDLNGYSTSATDDTTHLIKDAEVTMECRGVEIELSYSRRTKSYQTSSVAEAYAGDAVKIQAKLADGRVLSASTVFPSHADLKYSYSLAGGFTSKISRFLWGNSFTISWYTNNSGRLFFPQMTLYYSKLVGGQSVWATVPIPLKYLNADKKSGGAFPSYQFESSVSYDYAAIDSTVSLISQGDSAKGNYTIAYMYFQLVEFDAPLSNYYASVHGFTDRFSVRVDESIYTNINGGIGIFGAKCGNGKKIYFRDEYAKLFGYSAADGDN
jgi:hypothetical protein